MASKPQIRQEIEPVDQTDHSHGSPAQEPKKLNDVDSSSERKLSQEDLLKTICDKIPSAEVVSEFLKQELDVLHVIANSLRSLESSEETKIEFIWSSVLQFVGLLFVVVFGVFAALAYDAAGVANRQSSEANQLALLTFCLLNPNSVSCSGVSNDGLDSLNSVATAILGPAVTVKTTTSSSSTISSTFSSSSSTISTTASSSLASSINSGASTLTSTSPGPQSSETSSLTSTQSAISQPSHTSSIASPTTLPATSSHHLSTPAIVGTVLGVVFGLSSALVSCLTFTVKFRHRRYEGSQSNLQ